MRVESSPDNGTTRWYCQTAWVCLARSEGVTQVNQYMKLRNHSAGSNLVDGGRFAAHDGILSEGVRQLRSRI